MQALRIPSMRLKAWCSCCGLEKRKSRQTQAITILLPNIECYLSSQSEVSLKIFSLEP